MKLLRSNSVAFSRRHLVSVLICILCAGSCGPEKDKGNVHKRATSDNQRVSSVTPQDNQRVLAVTPHIISYPDRDLHLFIKNELDEPISTSDISFHIKDTPAYRLWAKDGWVSGESDLAYGVYTGSAVQNKEERTLPIGGWYMASDDDTKETKIGKGKCLKIIQPKEEFILVLFSESGTPELENVRLTFVISYKGKEVWSEEIPFPEWHIQPSE